MKEHTSIKHKIVDEAERLFWKYGVKSVTLDDISRRLGISKKTLYQHFSDKEDLVYQVVVNHFNAKKENVNCHKIDAHNAVDAMLMLSVMVRKYADSNNPNLLFDIERHYPKAWEEYRKYKEEFVFASIIENLEWGIRDGLYRDDINVEVLARLRLESMHLAMDEAVFPHDRFGLTDIQIELLHHFLRGMLTEKGFTIYNQFNHEL
ncbi:TetR/AcrR family transcriptional regulator [Arsenicibacter rosenii]|uniref:TetR/AcrR family transcriptional regulator n=1 Tax=Arsenicibacter rosenii TaxID=1750698 RepID=UPI000B00A09F|nr:TetR/AcrR family transcriptional regulator [Arsenicibacter rosenii]